MAIQTTEEQLEQVQSAITAVLNNQSYTIDGRTFTRAQLSQLEDRETRLKEEYAQDQGNKQVVQSFNLSGFGY
jgi:FixJ family two-component response regulator